MDQTLDVTEISGERTLDRVILREEVCAWVGLQDSALKEMEKAGQFPKRVRVGHRRIGWRMSEVQAWLASLEHMGAE